MKTLVSSFFLVITVCAASAQHSKTSRISDLNRSIIASQQAHVPDASSKIDENDHHAAAVAEKKKLSERITFLTDGSMTVIIPKGAVIHMPENGRISQGEAIEGRLVEWDEFLQANRNSIRLEPVISDHLKGDVQLTDEVIEQVTKSGLPTLTAYQGRVVALPTPPQTISNQP